MIPFQSAIQRAIRQTFQLSESSIFVVVRLPDRIDHILVTNNKKVFHGNFRAILQEYVSFLTSLVQVYYLQLKLRHGIFDEPDGFESPDSLNSYLLNNQLFHNGVIAKLDNLGEQNIRII